MKNDSVQYREIEGYSGYRIGSDGTVWSRWKRGGEKDRGFVAVWRQLTPVKIGKGYLAINLSKEERNRTLRYIHRLVLTAFVGPCPEGMQCCHNDGNRINNRLENLRWDTRKNNEADKVAHGTLAKGEGHGQAKLTAEQVIAIRTAYTIGGITKSELGARYGVSRSLIRFIVRREIWQHVA